MAELYDALRTAASLADVEAAAGPGDPMALHWLFDFDPRVAGGPKDSPRPDAVLADASVRRWALHLLDDRGVPPNYWCPDSKQLALWRAAQLNVPETVQLLCDRARAEDPEFSRKTDKVGQTPLFWAAKAGHFAVCRVLLDAGYDAGLVDQYGFDEPLAYAAKEGQRAVCELLVERKANVQHKNSKGKTALQWAQWASQNGCGEPAQQCAAYLRGLAMKRPKAAEAAKRARHVLMRLDEHGNRLQCAEEDLREFEAQFPRLCPWRNPEDRAWWDEHVVALLDKLLHNADFKDFARPLDTARLPLYTDKVLRPMDLGTLRRKLKAGEYARAWDFVEDGRRVWKNAIVYNHPEGTTASQRHYDLAIRGYAIWLDSVDKYCATLETWL